MPLIPLELSKSLLEELVRNEYLRTNRPLTGASLKPKLVDCASKQGFYFDERQLSFPSFLAFVQKCNVALRKRPGGDFLVTPVEHSAVLEGADVSERVRPDFWFGFLSFPKPNSVRYFDRRTGKIFDSSTVSSTSDQIAIPVITRQQQLEWRREFLRNFPNLPNLNKLIESLESETAFRDFSENLRGDPGLKRAWNAFLTRKVRDVISPWASQNNVDNSVWMSSSAGGSLTQRRAQIYELLDQVPFEELINWSVPLKWVLALLDKESK